MRPIFHVSFRVFSCFWWHINNTKTKKTYMWLESGLLTSFSFCQYFLFLSTKVFFFSFLQCFAHCLFLQVLCYHLLQMPVRMTVGVIAWLKQKLRPNICPFILSLTGWSILSLWYWQANIGLHFLVQKILFTVFAFFIKSIFDFFHQSSSKNY